MASLLSFNVPNSPRVVFGAGRLNELHTLPMPGKKALIVISKGKSTRANGYLDRLENELRQSGCAYVIFDRIQANPLKETVEEGAEWAKSENCDFIIVLGGGSVMDSAKVMAMKATNEGDLWDYVMSGTGKRMTPIHAPLPWIAIPTTAGTGSEVDAGGVITNLKTKEKLGIYKINRNCVWVTIITINSYYTSSFFYQKFLGKLYVYFSFYSSYWSKHNNISFNRIALHFAIV